MKKSLFVIPSLLLLGLGISLPQSAMALGDTCKNVKITIKNDTPDEIKVTKFEYFDFDKNKFRTENLLGIDGQQKLEPNKSFTVTRDLGQIKNDKTNFKVTYQHKIGGTKFEPAVSETTASFTCRDGITKTVSLTK